MSLPPTPVPIRAILFDAAGTLIHLPRGVGWHYREVAARHGVHMDENRLAKAFAESFKSAAPCVSSGVSRPDDDKLWWRALVRQVFANCGQHPADPQFDPLFEELYAHFAQPGVWALYPDAAATLQSLHGRYKLAIVSNFDRRLYRILDHLALRPYFDTIIISSELGADKPDPRPFTAALSNLAVTPAETIHVGDHPDQDWRAAELAGLHVYRLHRPTRSLEHLPAFVQSLHP